MRRPPHLVVLVALLSSVLAGCYTTSALRQSQRVVESGFDVDAFGPWVVVAGPGAVLVAGGVLGVASVLPLGNGVDPREPETKWFAGYPGAMRGADEVGVLCHRDNATWVTGIRSDGNGSWHGARHEKWHFPQCIELLPGRHELEVHYFARQHEGDREVSVSRQAESTDPSFVVWEARPGRVDALVAEISPPEPSSGTPPQRHIPRSRAMGTTWWELQQSSWVARIEPLAAWSDVDAELRRSRTTWVEWRGGR